MPDENVTPKINTPQPEPVVNPSANQISASPKSSLNGVATAILVIYLLFLIVSILVIFTSNGGTTYVAGSDQVFNAVVVFVNWLPILLTVLGGFAAIRLVGIVARPALSHNNPIYRILNILGLVIAGIIIFLINLVLSFNVEFAVHPPPASD